MSKEKKNEVSGSVQGEAGEDQHTEESLRLLSDYNQLQEYRVPGVRTTLIVLSATAMVFDVESLRQKVLLAYPDAAVFFITTAGKPLGVPSPRSVDLLVDFTGSGQRQGWLFARKLRGMARFAVGRNAGLFRKRIYDRIFDEKAKASELPKDLLDREGVVQKEVLGLAGIPVIPAGGVTPDHAKTVALDLPPLSNRS